MIDRIESNHPCVRARAGPGPGRVPKRCRTPPSHSAPSGCRHHSTAPQSEHSGDRAATTRLFSLTLLIAVPRVGAVEARMSLNGSTSVWLGEFGYKPCTAIRGKKPCNSSVTSPAQHVPATTVCVYQQLAT